MFELSCPLQEAALMSGNHPFLLESDRTQSFADIHTRVSALALALETLKLKPQSRVAVRLPVGADFVVLFFALHRAGLIPVLLSSRLPAKALNDQIAYCRCKVGIGEGPASDPELSSPLPKGFRWISFSALTEIPVKIPPVSRAPKAIRIPGEGCAAILFTSGSTGNPKAAALSHRAFYYNALASNQNIPLTSKDVWLATLPLWHVGGLGILYRTLLGGAAVAFSDHGEDLSESLESFNITHVSVVPTQLRRLLHSARPGQTWMKRLKAVLIGGAPISSGLLEDAENAGLPLRLSYGLSESASQITTTPRYAHLDARRTSGQVLASGCELQIDPSGQIQIRGRTLFSGYLQPNGRLHLPIDRQGWFSTGDMGSLDDRGYLTVTGRIDNRFISGGENIQPEEIEAVLRLIPGVEDAVVVPVPDAEFGERPFAFFKAITPWSRKDAEAHIRKHLAGFQVPVGFHPFPSEEEAKLKPSRRVFQKLALELMKRET